MILPMQPVASTLVRDVDRPRDIVAAERGRLENAFEVYLSSVANPTTDAIRVRAFPIDGKRSFFRSLTRKLARYLLKRKGLPRRLPFRVIRGERPPYRVVCRTSSEAILGLSEKEEIRAEGGSIVHTRIGLPAKDLHTVQANCGSSTHTCGWRLSREARRNRTAATRRPPGLLW